MKIFDRIKNPALAELVKEQNLKDLILKREFRITEAYIQREFVVRAIDDDLPELSITLHDGYGLISGKMKRKLIPFAIPFSGRFSMQSVEFSRARKVLHLKLYEVGPVDLEWLTKKVVRAVPFLTYADNVVECNLMQVPRLAELFAYRVKGINPWDFITLKELSLEDGAIVGRVGVVI